MMKRLIALLSILFLLMVPSVYAFKIKAGTAVSWGTSTPAKCNIGDLFIDTDDDILYICTSADNWETASSVWGGITGTLSNQIDLQGELDDKQDNLTNEAGLYGALSDVNNFGQTNKPENLTAAWIFNDDIGEFHGTDHDIWTGWDASDVRYAFKYLTDSTTNTNEELDISETVITVVASSVLTANEIIKIESEYMSVVSIDDGTTITVVRGALGSTVATHVTAKDIYELRTIFAFDPTNKTTWSYPTSNPEVILNDIDNPGTDKYSFSWAAQYVDGADESENSDLYGYINKGGAKTTIVHYDESNDEWVFTGYITGGVKIVVDADGGDASAYCYGGIWYATGAGIVVLDAVAEGMSITVVNDTADTVQIDPDGTERIKIDGVLAAEGELIEGTDLNDCAVCTYYSPGVWFCSTVGYEEDTPP